MVGFGLGFVILFRIFNGCCIVLVKFVGVGVFICFEISIIRILFINVLGVDVLFMVVGVDFGVMYLYFYRYGFLNK